MLDRRESCHYTKKVRKRGRRPRLDSDQTARNATHNFHENGLNATSPTSPTDTLLSSNISLSSTPNCMQSLEPQTPIEKCSLEAPTSTTMPPELHGQLSEDSLTRLYRTLPRNHVDPSPQETSPNSVRILSLIGLACYRI